MQNVGELFVRLMICDLRVLQAAGQCLLGPEGNRRGNERRAEVALRFRTAEASQRAYAVADNKLVLNADRDSDRLRVEIANLQAFDFDLGMTGFFDEEVVDGVSSDGCASSDPTDAPIHL
jgi:hypothetical protein